MKLAVVGAGPAGARLALDAARDGARVVVFDPAHPREKPCGGGLTAKGLAEVPAAPAHDPLPARFVADCRLESGEGEAVRVSLDRPVAIVSRREFDAWLLRRAQDAGAEHRAERVVEVDGDGSLRTASGERMRFDAIVGADGANSLVRRTFLEPTPPERRFVAAGWYAPGDSEMVVRFLPGVAGYLWLFPRRDHVAIGVGAPLRRFATRELLARLEAEVERDFPRLAGVLSRYAHTIPSPSADRASILELAGPRWALVGDAGALADPITGEGLYYALRSARVLADVLRETGSPAGYPTRALADFGHELLASARLFDRFYAPGYARRMVRYAQRSHAIREVLGELVLGDQGYVGLRRRLLRALPRFLWDSALERLRLAA